MMVMPLRETVFHLLPKKTKNKKTQIAYYDVIRVGRPRREVRGSADKLAARHRGR